MEGETRYRAIDNLKATELRLGMPGTDDLAERLTQGIKRSKETNDQEITPVAEFGTSCRMAASSIVWEEQLRAKAKTEEETGLIYVKVSMDGAPYLRKINLKVYKGYNMLREGLEELFKYFSLGLEGCNDSEYAITQDKDGDWMLVGDVPWPMFISSLQEAEDNEKI